MKEKWELFKISLTEEKTMSKREWLLVLAVCVLGGIVFGMFFSPRKNVTIGSNNGNNSGNYTGEEDRDENNQDIVTLDVTEE